MINKIFFPLILLSSAAFAGTPQSTYGLDDIERGEYCAKSVDGYFNEGSVGEHLLSAFTWGQDKYNPFIWMMRGNSDRHYQIGEMMNWHPGGFQRCFLTSSLPEIKPITNCQVIIATISAENPVSDLKNNFCFAQVPKSKKDFLSPGVDVPAAFITPFSKKAVKEESPIRLPLQFSKEINSEADQIWEALLKCSENDPEVARLAFVTNKSACPELNDRMSTFKTNFFNSLLQSEPRIHLCPDYGCGEGLEFADNRLNYEYFYDSYSKTGGVDDSTQRDYLSQMNRTRNSYAMVHPLISQMALQVLIKMYFTEGSQSFFNRDRLTKELSHEYHNLFYNLTDIILTVNNGSGIPMGLYPNAGWAAWAHMRERVILSKERLAPSWKRHSSKEYQKYDGKMAKWDLQRFYHTFNPNYGVVTSNIQMVNLPAIYFKQGKDILEQFYKADTVFTNIKIQEDKK